jgi:O-antigen/teichoic acid export membrane protein
MGTSRRRAATATMVGSTTNTLIVSIQAVVLIPLYLQAIGPRLYGAWLGSGDILVWMYAFDLGLPNLMIQRIGAAHGRGDLKTVAEYFATGIVALGFVAIAIVLCAVAIAYPLPRWMGLVGDEAATLRQCFMVGALAQGVNIFNNSVVGFSRGIQDTMFMNMVVVASGVVGFGVSLGLVLMGWGLWAIALGLAIRAVVSFVGGVIFSVLALRGEMLHFFRLRRRVMREFLVVSPATALGGVSYAVMNQSEAALVAIFLRPELATVFTLTRKALDVARGLVNAIAFATYGGFAHLVTSSQRHRTLRVHAEVRSLRLSLSVVLAAAYMTVNASLVSVWVGSSFYGGTWLTILLAVQFIVLGGSFLMNYLYRATGPVMKGSIALFVESVLRIPLMIGLLIWVGLPGAPIAGIITASLFWWLAYRWTLAETASFSEFRQRFAPWLWAGRMVLLGLGMLACVFVLRESWIYVLISGSAVVAIGAAFLILVDPLLDDIRTSLVGIMNRLRVAVHG